MHIAHAESNPMIEYLCEIETEFEIISACLSGPKWIRIRKTNSYRKSPVNTLPSANLTMAEVA